jgi:hypothetical protein
VRSEPSGGGWVLDAEIPLPAAADSNGPAEKETEDDD